MLRRNSALLEGADFKPPACEQRADGIEIPTLSRWQVKNPMQSSRLAINWEALLTLQRAQLVLAQSSGLTKPSPLPICSLAAGLQPRVLRR